MISIILDRQEYQKQYYLYHGCQSHKRIDLLKMDIEGFEYEIFESWPELAHTKLSENILLPHQILVEVREKKQPEGILFFLFFFTGEICFC